MVCSKCNRFNMSDLTVCAHCGAELKENEAATRLKSFAGGRFGIDEKPLSAEKQIEDGENTVNASVAENETEKVFPESGFDSITEKVSFEDEFEMDNITFLDYENKQEEAVYTRGEKKALRNTALLAVILAVLIDAILVVWMVVYFRGLAERIVNVNQEASMSIQMQADDDICLNSGIC